jgi:hypothetical protein
VSEPSERPPAHRFDLTGVPPVRAFAISAGAALVAIVLFVVWGQTDLVVALVLGIAVLLFAVSLTTVALLLTRRLRTTVVLAPDAVTVVRGRDTREQRWAEIDHVDLKGPRLTFTVKGDAQDLVVVNPRTPTDTTFMTMLAEIQQRLDADRGYQTTTS